MTPKYPHVEVELVGQDGNAFAIMGRVSMALRNAGVSNEEIQAYTKESMSGDYDHLLRTALAWITPTSADEDDEMEDTCSGDLDCDCDGCDEY